MANCFRARDEGNMIISIYWLKKTTEIRDVL